jgi:predicted phage terminase large subunit-like protein
VGQSPEQLRNIRLEAARGIRDQDYATAERSLEHFYRCAWDEVLEPTKPLLDSWYQGYVSEYLEACYLRQIKRLIINMPPRYGKSSLVSVAFPSWVWQRKPGLRFMSFSYSMNLSTKHSMDRRTVIESQWYQRRWGTKFSLDTDSNQKTQFSNDKRGHMLASSLHGSGTGLGGDFLIVDDPHDTTRAGSKLKREADVQAFDRKVRTRLDDKMNGVIILVMQRLDENDMVGHVEKTEGLVEAGGEWTKIKVQGVARRKTIVVFPRTGRELVRPPGDVLLPAYEDLDAHRKMKRGMGSYGYSGQYDQDPSPASGGIIKRKWWRRWKVLPDRLDDSLISADTSFKGEEDSDWVVFQAWGKKGPKKYLIDQVRGQMDFPTACQAFLDFCAAHPKISRKVIEDKANGPAMIAVLKDKLPGLVAFNPKTSKVERARAVSPTIEAGDVEIPEDGEWVGDFVEECTAFPKGATADRVDTMTQALLVFEMASSGEFGESMKQTHGTIVGPRDGPSRW